MVDLHHHLLYGMDDGSPDLETSVEMAKMAVADGITHVVCTPHASGRYQFEPEVVAERLTALREALAAAEVPLRLGSGCDFHLSYDNLRDALAYPKKYTVNATEYLLVELPDHGLSPNLDNLFYDLRVAGMTPILTHPERNPTLQRDLPRLAEWLRNGMLVQVTAGAVTGEMGRMPQKIAHQLLEDRWVHFIATDAHNLDSRPPRMSAAYEWIKKRHGADYAERLCSTHPQAVFEGRPLLEIDEALHLFDEEEIIGLPWWKRVFRSRT